MSPLPTSAYDRAAALIAAVFVGLIATACWINFVDPRPVDFLSYWAAAQMAIEGRSEATYDIAAHRSVEMSAAPAGGMMPFPYPPPFLLVVAPFGLLPFEQWHHARQEWSNRHLFVFYRDDQRQFDAAPLRIASSTSQVRLLGHRLTLEILGFPRQAF